VHSSETLASSRYILSIKNVDAPTKGILKRL